MPTNEEGEFELILGNRQLLSVFFVVVLLLGVFFTMGYVVGRNTSPGGTQLASGKGAPIVVDPAVANPPPSVPPSGERPSPSGAATPAEPPPAPKEEPPPAPKAEPVKPPAAKPEPPKPEPPKPEPPKAEPPKAAPAAGGTYLQVAATRKPEADLLAEVLTKKGYPTVVSPVPDSALVRVLVGPVQSESLAKTREALVAAGFKPFPRAKL